jgi:hypothetical protein
LYIILEKGWESSVGIATSYSMNSQGAIPRWCKMFFLLHGIQTDSGAHPASYPMDTGAISPEIKKLVPETDHSPPSSAKVKNGGAIPPLPIH